MARPCLPVLNLRTLPRRPCALCVSASGAFKSRVSSFDIHTVAMGFEPQPRQSCYCRLWMLGLISPVPTPYFTIILLPRFLERSAVLRIGDIIDQELGKRRWAGLCSPASNRR